MMDEREKIQSPNVLSRFDSIERNLNFFFLFHSFIGIAPSKKLKDKKKKKNEKTDADTIVLIKYLYNIFLSYGLRVCSDTREKNTIAVLVLNSPCMNSYHPHID